MNIVDDFFKPKQLPKHLDGSSLRLVPDVLGSDRSSSRVRFLSVSSVRLGLWGTGCQKPSLRKGWKPRRWWSPCPGATPGCAHIPVPLSKNVSASPFSLEQIQLKPPLPAPVEEALNCTGRSSHSNQVASCKDERNRRVQTQERVDQGLSLSPQIAQQKKFPCKT